MAFVVGIILGVVFTLLIVGLCDAASRKMDTEGLGLYTYQYKSLAVRFARDMRSLYAITSRVSRTESDWVLIQSIVQNAQLYTPKHLHESVLA